MAKDCMGGIRDPDWLDLPPIASLGMGVHSLANLPSNSTIKKKAAIIIMAVEVGSTSITSCLLIRVPSTKCEGNLIVSFIIISYLLFYYAIGYFFMVCCVVFAWETR
jgi:hypothetical protein